MKIRSLTHLVAMTLLSASTATFAAGFQLFEGNAASVTNFGSGGAATAEDASTSTYNPAGLVRINQAQLVGSLIGVFFDTQFSGATTWRDPAAPFLPAVTETGIAKGGKNTPIPALHFAMPINESLFAGISVTAPFGLSTDYDIDTVLRYAGTKTKLVTIDVSPALAYKFNNQFSIGAGVDWQHATVEFDSVGGVPLFGTTKDTKSINKGHDNAWGWHAGVLGRFNDDKTRVGFDYQSDVKYNLTGTSRLIGPLANSGTGGEQVSNNLHGRITLPSSMTLSVYQTLDPTWSVMGSVIRTNWSVFKTIRLENVAGVNSLLAADNTVVASTQENYRDTWRFVVGVDHRCSKKLTVRTGLGYDQTPVNDHDRNIRLPDGDRIATAIGLSYQVNPKVAVDVGYTHLFVRNAHINNSIANGNPVTAGSVAGSTVVSQAVDVIGRTRTGANLIGAQFRVNLG